MDTMLFDFNNMDKSAKEAAKFFARAGANVVQHDVSTSVKRSSGVSYREVYLTFADSQQLTLRVKASGDIFQVMLNGKMLPVKNQSDHIKAVSEVVAAMDAGRTKFQKLLAAAKVKLPPAIKTTAPKMEQVLTEKRDALKTAIDEVRAEIAKFKEPVTA